MLLRCFPPRTVSHLPCKLQRVLSSVAEHSQGHHVALRKDLATAHTLSAHYRFDELVWNHISARVDAAGEFLVTPGDKLFEEVRAHNLVLSSGHNANITADVIHKSIYKSRPDVNAIVHHHTPPVVAVSALKEGLRFVTQDSAAFHKRVAYHAWEGISDDYDECARLGEVAKEAACIHTVFLRHHGALTFGRTVAEAWVRYFYLDRVCRAQVMLMSANSGYSVSQPSAEVLEHAAQQYGPEGLFCHGFAEWPALTRLAERLQKASDIDR